MSLAKVTMNRITPANVHLMICDMQERCRTKIRHMPATIQRATLLSKSCGILDIPCIISEHNPEKYESTIPEIPRFASTKVFTKKRFSMVTTGVSAALTKAERSQVFLW